MPFYTIPDFQAKDWKNLPDQTTPISAEALKDLEDRLANYSSDLVWPFRDAGLLIGVDRDDYEPPNLGDVVVADIFGHGPEPGQKGDPRPGGSEKIGRAGPFHIDKYSQRVNIQTAARILAIGDNAQMRFTRGPGWGHGYPIGSENVVRRRPVGQSTFVTTPASPGANQLYIFPAKTFANYWDESIQDNNGNKLVHLFADGQEITYTGKVSVNAALSGDAAIGNTEFLVAEQNIPLPSSGGFRIRSLQMHYTGREIVLDAVMQGVHRAGTNTIEVRNVSQAEWDAIPTTPISTSQGPRSIGCLRIERGAQGGRIFKYIDATYDSVTQRAIFTLDAGNLLDRNVIDGGLVTMHKLTGITTDFVHFTEEHRAAGEITLPMAFWSPYSGDPVDPALIEQIPTSGTLRVETREGNPLGPGQLDYPVEYLEYDDFDGKIVHLAEPLPRDVPLYSFVDIENCPGILRERTSGMQIAMHRLDGVAGLDDGAAIGKVVEFSPRYGQPSSGEGGAHIALDRWAGPSGIKGYSTNLSMTHSTQGVGTKDPGAEMRFMARVPISGYQIQTNMWAARGQAVFGAGVRGLGDIKHKLSVGDVYTRVKPPNIVLDPCDPELDPECDPDAEPEEPGSGTIVSATLNVATVIGFDTVPMPTKVRVSTHNRESGTTDIRTFRITGFTEGPPNPQLLGLSFDQSTEGPKSVLQGAHDLATITELDIDSIDGWVTPQTQHAGKWRAKDSGGTVIATGTYTGRDTTAASKLTGIVVLTGSGILPSDTLIEENYSIGDFWVDSGAEISLADEVRHAAIGSATNVVAGTDRPKQTEIGVVTPNGDQGVAMGDLVIWEREDGELGIGLDGFLEDDYLIKASEKGSPFGVTPLDSGGHIAASFLPASAQEFLGSWDASTNTPTLVDGTGNAGDFYRVIVAGSQDFGSGSITFQVNDGVQYDGTEWFKVDQTDAVASVNSYTGVVDLDIFDIGLDASVAGDALGLSGITLNVKPADPLGIVSDELTIIDTALLALSGLEIGSDRLPYFNSSDTAALTDLTSYIRGLLGANNAAAARVVLGVGAETDVSHGVYGYLVPEDKTAKISEGQYFVVAENSIVEIDGTVEMDGETLELVEA